MTRALLALALLSACWDVPGDEFTPQSFIEKLRVLGVRAEPAELHPGDTAHLDALVVDPSSRTLTYLWLLCDPDPTNPFGSACANQEIARDPRALLTNPPPGLRVVVGPPELDYTAPATSPPGVANVLLLVFPGTLDDLANPATEKQPVLKRVKVTPPGAPLNANPRLADVLAEGVPVPAGTTFDAPRHVTGLSATVAEGASEAFLRHLPGGTTLDADEYLLVSWFTTAGRFDTGAERGDRTKPTEIIGLSLPAPELKADVFAVLRDARGGLDWRRISVHRLP